MGEIDTNLQLLLHSSMGNKALGLWQENSPPGPFGYYWIICLSGVPYIPWAIGAPSYLGNSRPYFRQDDGSHDQRTTIKENLKSSQYFRVTFIQVQIDGKCWNPTENSPARDDRVWAKLQLHIPFSYIGLIPFGEDQYFENCKCQNSTDSLVSLWFYRAPLY